MSCNCKTSALRRRPMEPRAPDQNLCSQPGPVHPARMLGYASGNFGKNALASTMDFFLLFILTERWGVSPAIAGLVVMIGLVWDGICDPLLGMLLDRPADRNAVYRRILFVGAPVVGMVFAIFFIDPKWRGNSIVIWAVAAVMLFRTAYSACDVAHNALMMRLTTTPGSATTVSGLRYMFSCLGALAVAHFASAFVATPRESGYDLVAVTGLAAISYVGTLWISASSAPQRMPARAAVAPPASPGWIIANRPLLLLLALGFAQALTLPVFARCFAYIGKGVLQDASWTGTALTMLAAAQLVALPIWMTIARRLERRAALGLALVAVAAGLAVFAIEPTLAMAGIALFGVGNAGLQMMIWVLLADAVDHGERRTGIRCEGLPVALLLLALKIGGGLSGALLGHGLTMIGWSAGAPIGPRAQRDLLAMAWIPPLIGALACLTVLACLDASRRSGAGEQR
ncbi:MFS transporter [Sphingomonas pollutisoli]|uniref:MFS transporter n=1 Tax=Sphingomonas pollutisoli TaxID=3030829 RepID=UPI0030B85A0A